LESAWDEVVGEVRRRAGLNLAGYKPRQVQRRLHGLMLRSGVQGWDEYLRLLEREPGRRQELWRCVTVAVSEFFRTPEQFDHLAGVVLPGLLQRRRHLRVWSAGCSYGAEPYSVALLLHELSPGVGHTILGTDVDELALARARAAESFTERDLRHVPASLRRHFSRASGQDRFDLSSALRSSVTFQRHDLLGDPPGADFDLVLCRNVMMYFTDEAKRGLFASLFGALRAGGCLFVGDAEVLNELPEAGFIREAVGFYRK
jgi:chemotaxis protein methyltransferase CheR